MGRPCIFQKTWQEPEADVHHRVWVYQPIFSFLSHLTVQQVKWHHSHRHIQDGHRLRSNLMCLSSLVLGPIKFTITMRHQAISKLNNNNNKKNERQSPKPLLRLKGKNFPVSSFKSKKKKTTAISQLSSIKTVIPKRGLDTKKWEMRLKPQSCNQQCTHYTFKATRAHDNVIWGAKILELRTHACLWARTCAHAYMCACSHRYRYVTYIWLIFFHHSFYMGLPPSPTEEFNTKSLVNSHISIVGNL